ncbi:cation:proton antiporter [Zunongwangia sp. F260]|uniref:Cation:proton antiporter n=1 Tax=Autumnicola lenta TaxID=3075593 RepID=A0ABU3CJ77_9FLAO|nr:cation:proton antiporter [Zunongwangia sp. F260]MDT0646413.1 cation:proton antiporter [Zunongwangia sp. F260]
MTVALLDISLPLENPVLKFLVILLIILFTPILLNKIKIPNLLGLILAGAVIGPNGLNLMERDSGIILSGTAGLLYIMFLAGLEIDLADFKKNTKKSFVFGMFTFSIPMIMGIFTGLYIFQFSVLTSVLLASMFASHTLIAYPLVSKLGVARNRAVNITVGGTMITDILALLVLAVIVGMTKGEVNTAFWLKLTVSVLTFGAIVMFVFPVIARWFFKKYDDNVTQYIFVLALVFFGAILAEIAGIEAIIGAFLSGLALNRLIPRTSPLMNRVEFVGNAIFIPFFLIGIGMLIDFRVFFQGWEAIWIAAVMTIVATLAKFLAAWLTQKTYSFSIDERRLIFGLSNAQAAATLAAVIIGYNIILGESETGEPVRLLNENVLNGTILMILVTCTVASFVAQKGARNLALSEVGLSTGATAGERGNSEKILIPVSNTETLDELIHLGLSIKSEKKSKGLYALTIIDNNSLNPEAEKKAREVLHRAAVTASATDNHLQELLRYDLNIVNGIAGAVKENGITDLIIGLHVKEGISDSFLGELTEGVLARCNTTTLIYKPAQPLATIKKHIIVVPENAEKEIGFPFWINKIWNIAENSGAELVFYATTETLKLIKNIQVSHAVECSFREFIDWSRFEDISKDVGKNDNLIIVLSRRNKISYQQKMVETSSYLNNQFKNNSFILIYPMQEV